MKFGAMTAEEIVRFCRGWDCRVCPLNLDRPFWEEESEDGLCVGVCALRMPKRWTRLDEELPEGSGLSFGRTEETRM